MLQNVYNKQVWRLAHKSEDHNVRVQHLEIYMWQQQCKHLSLGTKCVFPDAETADTRVHFGIHLEWVKETRMCRNFCECTIAYIGETGCSNKTSTTVSSILNKSAIDEHGINILLKDKGVLVRKYSHINFVMLGMIVIELCCDKMFTV
jgi:hypothetical protein